MIALVSNQEGINLKEANETYMKIQEFQYDMEGFNFSQIIGVDELFLENAPGIQINI